MARFAQTIASFFGKNMIIGYWEKRHFSHKIGKNRIKLWSQRRALMKSKIVLRRSDTKINIFGDFVSLYIRTTSQSPGAVKFSGANSCSSFTALIC
jgi:hypothetical protein